MTQQELLFQTEDPRDFAFALMIFKGELTRLKDALLWLSSEDMIEIREVEGIRPLEVSQLKAIWCDDANFLNAKRAKRYLVHATDKGLDWAYGGPNTK